MIDRTLIRLDAVGKVYSTEEVDTHALSNVQITVKENEFVEVVGPSGCGKSTLLSLLGLLDRPTTGEYYLDGEAVSQLSASEWADIRNLHIGFIFQTFNLIGDLSVAENVELPLVYRNMPRRQREERVHLALERVGMGHRANHYPAQLSGGQQQRVAAARAVVGDPLIILADEPTGNLDSTSGEAVMELLRELHEDGATILMVTHDPRYSKYAERTVQLLDGRVV